MRLSSLSRKLLNFQNKWTYLNIWWINYTYNSMILNLNIITLIHQMSIILIMNLEIIEKCKYKNYLVTFQKLHKNNSNF
jgi:hypothetical protein